MPTSSKLKTSAKTRPTGKVAAKARPRCGLCGKRGKLTKTACCDQWICDDQENYVLFSYARNSCSRNHHRYTLCGFHFNEGHKGSWQDCKKCRKDLGTEMYVHHGTNEYNFEKLTNPPDYEPTRCATCSKVIRLALDGYAMSGGKIYCFACPTR